jgi:PIN domain nuclease of toxin-antitoxin system
VRLLLDTHVAVWSITESHRIPRNIHDLISDPQNEAYVSAATIWEIAVKHMLGKRSATPFSGEEAIGHFANASYTIIDVTARHAAAVERYRLDHADPFDRLILAQAKAEPMRLITKDSKLIDYSDTVITW